MCLVFIVFVLVSVVICGMDVGLNPPSDRMCFSLLSFNEACGNVGIKCDLAVIPAKYPIACLISVVFIAIVLAVPIVIICGMDVGLNPPLDRTYFLLLYGSGACGDVRIKCVLAHIQARYLLP